jgi:hypothetical protein
MKEDLRWGRVKNLLAQLEEKALEKACNDDRQTHHSGVVLIKAPPFHHVVEFGSKMNEILICGNIIAAEIRPCNDGLGVYIHWAHIVEPFAYCPATGQVW